LARSTKLPRAFPHPIMPTERKTFVLLISRDPAAVESVRNGLSNRPEDFSLQTVQTIETAMARIAGGGVDLVLLDISARSGSPERRLDPFLDLHRACPTVPVVILCEAGDENLAAEAQRVGAADRLLIEQVNARLAGLIDTVVANNHTPVCSPQTAARGAAKIVTFMGVKGGVGTTLAALNVASALSRKSTVILAELRPAQGVLCRYFHPHPPLKTTANLLTLQTDSISAAAVQACLWVHGNMPGLRILFAPEAVQPPPGVRSEAVKPVLQLTTALADYVVVDLSSCWSDEHKAVIANSDLLAIVVERDPICIETAQSLLHTFTSLDIWPQFVEAVVVNRTPLSRPVPLAEIELQLDIPLAGVIPPAADLCIAAQRAHLPVVAFEPASGLAAGFSELAAHLSTAMAPLLVA